MRLPNYPYKHEMCVMNIIFGTKINVWCSAHCMFQCQKQNNNLICSKWQIQWHQYYVCLVDSSSETVHNFCSCLWIIHDFFSLPDLQDTMRSPPCVWVSVSSTVLPWQHSMLWITWVYSGEYRMEGRVGVACYSSILLCNLLCNLQVFRFALQHNRAL